MDRVRPVALTAATSHLARIGVAIAFVIVLTLLPFLPGRYDPFAVALSAMARVFGMAGLLLVPIGAVWLGYELRRRPSHDEEPRDGATRDEGRVVALVVFVAASLVGLIVALTALVFGGLAFGLCTLAAWGYLVWIGIARSRTERGTGTLPSRAWPVSLTVVPLAVALIQSAIVERAVELSRERAIVNGARLIADIERYREEHGRYPPSLHAVNQDYPLRVIGVRGYQYEPSGEAYNVYFEHAALHLDTREIVMYNPRDEHVMTSHDADLLQYTGAELARRRGYYAVHAASRPGWKYFWFD